MRPRALLIALALVLLGIAAPAAHAATASVSGTTLSYTAAAGETNHVAISLSGSTYTISDPGLNVTAGSGCTSAVRDRVTCTLVATRVSVDVGDMNDAVTDSAPTAATVTGGAGDDVLSTGSGADTLNGGDGNDRLYGGSGSDVLDAGAGDDYLDGGTGGDQLWGGSGTDTVDYGSRTAALTVDLDGNADDGEPGERDNAEYDLEVVQGGSGNDRITGGASDDRLYGGGGNDALDGAAGNDLVDGRGGDDSLRGGPGADTLVGGDGRDTADYSDRSAGVGVWLDGVANDGELYEGDNVTPGIEKVVGGSGNDFLAGDGGENTLSGGAGDDVLQGGAGADTLNGGGGTNTIDFGERFTPVSVDTGSNSDSDGDHFGDDIQNVTGGWGNDRLTGGDGDNVLNGGAGDDTLDGKGGADTYYAGAGNDSVDAADGVAELVDCGAGSDDATTDTSDNAIACETGGKPPPDGTSKPPPGRPVTGKIHPHVVRGKGKFVSFGGVRIDSRLTRDLTYLRAHYHVAFTAGFAMEAHAPGGEHPLGLAVDIVPGQGGSWNDVDRLARWAEPRQNHPRAPFRWVGYNGDAGHGRGNHLHLSWMHAAAKRGHPARWVEVMTEGKPQNYEPPGTGGRVSDLRSLAKVSNRSIGHAPHVTSGLSGSVRCSGAQPLVPTFKRAAKAFGLRWQVLAGITQIESGFGCNMGPSSAGAIGWTQFMPATWEEWGMDADGDGTADPYNSVDAIFSTARYLRANGAPHNYKHAIFAYNHADWYVKEVLGAATRFKSATVAAAAAVPKRPLSVRRLPRIQTVR